MSAKISSSAVCVVLLALGASCAARPSTCSEEQVREIAGFVEGLRAAAERPGVPLPEDLELPLVASSASAVDDATLVVLDRRGLRMAGRPVDAWRDTERLAEEVAREESIAEATRTPFAPMLVAAIAVDVPACDVDDLLALARRSGFRRIGFVAHAADAPPLPAAPLPELAAALREHAAGGPRRAESARLLDAEVARCPPLGERFEDNFPGAGSILLTTQQALLACGCAADVDRVLTLAHAWISPQPTTIISPSYALAPDGEALVTRPDAPWSELAPAMFEGSRAAVRLRIEPGCPGGAGR